MIRMELGKNSYNIELERGNLDKASELLNLNRKVMIITDEECQVLTQRRLPCSVKRRT